MDALLSFLNYLTIGNFFSLSKSSEPNRQEKELDLSGYTGWKPSNRVLEELVGANTKSV